MRPRLIELMRGLHVSDTTESGATYAIDGLLLETENNNQPLVIVTTVVYTSLYHRRR